MAYNADGNPRLDDGTSFEFTYDGLQRLVETYRPQGTATTSVGLDVQESYDAMGLRVFKSVQRYTAAPGGTMNAVTPAQGSSTQTASASTVKRITPRFFAGSSFGAAGLCARPRPRDSLLRRMVARTASVLATSGLNRP